MVRELSQGMAHENQVIQSSLFLQHFTASNCALKVICHIFHFLKYRVFHFTIDVNNEEQIEYVSYVPTGCTSAKPIF